MLIPPFNLDGILPPFVGASPAESARAMAPYEVELIELVERFATSPERINILDGLLAYRQQLRDLSIFGLQWLDGSFVEDIESSERARPPGDVDIVTFVAPGSSAAANAAVVTHVELFDRDLAKAKFKCDPQFVDMTMPSAILIRHLSYWLGLFSHQRETGLWKGLLQVELSAGDEDVAAREALALRRGT